MQEEITANVSKVLPENVTKIDELFSQYRHDFQTYYHKICYLCDAVAKFSEWSLIPTENINFYRYRFNCPIINMYESIQTKTKVKMLQGKAIVHSVLAHTQVLRHSCDPRYVSRDMIASKLYGTHSAQLP